MRDGKELRFLLNNYWCLKESNPKEYFNIKNNLDYYKDFLRDKLGSKLTINDRFIKLEKIPAVPKEYMGIPSFTDKMEYILLFIILLFLEDKPKSYQFVLSNLIDYISNMAITLGIDNVPNWNLLRHRSCLINVMKHIGDIGIIKIIDEENFLENKSAEALYESVGLSNYYIREFKNNILDYTNINDYVNDEFSNQSENIGDVRRYKVYRGLIYSMCSYKTDLSIYEEDYLKKFRDSINSEISKYLDSELEITKSMSLIVSRYETREKYDFPNNKAISDIVLLFNSKILLKIDNGDLSLDNDECVLITKEEISRFIKEVRDENCMYFSKKYKDMTLDNFILEVISYLKEYDFIRVDDLGYKITPSVSRLVGYIPKDTTFQLDLFGGGVSE